jgi:hypothetical protein
MEYKKVAFAIPSRFSVLCASADRQILFMFGIYEFIRHRSVLGEYEHSNSLDMGPKT